MISILRKELRDCLKWVPAGMLIAVVMVWQTLPSRLDSLYSLQSSLTASFGWSAALIAFALGLLQSLFDVRNDARGYLLHRPVRRSDIFWAKLAAGFIASVLALLPAVLLAVVYLNNKGLDLLPVSGMQVIPGLLLSLAVFLLHPIAMWIGNRDANWVGTRVLPLAGITTILICIYAIYESGFPSHPAYVEILLTVLNLALHIVAIIIVLVAAKHAFCKRQMLPPASENESSSWASFVGLTFSSIVVATFATTFVIQTLSTNKTSYSNRQILMNADGEFQQVKSEQENWNWNDVKYSVRPAEELTDDFVPVNDQWKIAEYSVISEGYRVRYSWFRQFGQLGNFGTDSKTRGLVTIFSHRSRLLAYERGHLSAIISPQSVSRDGKIPDDKFQNLAMFTSLKSGQTNNGQLGANPLLVDSTGVYQLDSNTFAMNQLLPESVDRVCMLFADDQSPATLWTVNGDTLTQHVISAIDDGVALNEKTLISNHTVEMPLIKINASKEFKIDSLDSETWYSISVFRANDGRYGYVRYNNVNEGHFGFLEEDGAVAKVGPVVIPSIPDSSQDKFALGIPPILGFGQAIWKLFNQPTSSGGLGLLVFAIMHSLFAAVGTFLIGKWMDLSLRQCLTWTIFALFAGFGICLAVVACHRRLVKEACSHCKTPTRVDLESCTQCGKEWLPPELDQIEIFDDALKAA